VKECGPGSGERNPRL